MLRDTILYSIATILWGDAWATHVEEHDCCSLAGQEITHIMPTIPDKAFAMARELVTRLESANGCTVEQLFARAKAADPTVTDDAAERFGDCLAWEAMGAGVSWEDDYLPYPHKRVNLENFALVILAHEQCDDNKGD